MENKKNNMTVRCEFGKDSEMSFADLLNILKKVEGSKNEKIELTKELRKRGANINVIKKP